MTEGLKWTVNHVARSDDKHLELMSEENVKKANEFHKSFPQYTVTPLQDLAELASYLGVKSIHCKDESYRFGLNAFKVLGGSYAMGRYIAKEVGKDISELPYAVLSSEELRKELMKNFTLENPIYLTVSPIGTNMEIINKNKAILSITFDDLLPDYNIDGGEFELKVEINSKTKIECKGGIDSIERLGDVSLDIIKIKLDKNTINDEIPVATYFMSSNGN